MKEKFKVYNVKDKYIIFLLLLLFKNILNDNEIKLVINKARGEDIINKDYYNYISEVVVNGLSENIVNYTDLLINGINNITIKFNNYLNNCSFMFYGLSNIKYINTFNFYSSNVKSTKRMFSECNSLTSIDLTNFDTSSVIDMNNMFSFCSSLISLDLRKFDTSSVSNMSFMFYNCSSLISLYIDQFDVSSVNNFSYIFYGCQSLVSLNLTNFDFNTNNFDKMFSNCNPNLKYYIDGQKTYKLLDLLNSYCLNCYSICESGNAEMYLISQFCVDSKKTTKKKSYTGLIIGINAGILGVIIIIIIFIICRNKHNKKDTITMNFTEKDVDGNNHESISVDISKEKKVDDLIKMYLEKIKIKNANEIIFLYKKKYIDLEKDKYKVIREFFKINNDDNSESKQNITSQPPSIYNLKIENIDDFTVFVVKNIKIIFKETINYKQNGKTEINICPKKSIADLIDSYYKNKGFKNEGQYKFLFNESNIDSKESKKITIVDFIQNSQNSDISVIEKGKQIINFISINNDFKLVVPIEITMSDLIDIYYKETLIKNDNKKIFLCKEENIILEKNKKIKDYIEKGLEDKDLNIFIFGKENIKVNFFDNERLIFEEIIPRKTKQSELKDMYYKKSKISKDDKIIFTFDGNANPLNKDESIEGLIKKDKYFISIVANDLENSFISEKSDKNDLNKNK